MNEMRTGGGGASLTLLWENPKPTQAFNEQTLPINTSEYDWLMIYGVSSLESPQNYATGYVCVENNPAFVSWFVFTYYKNTLPTVWGGDIRQRYINQVDGGLHVSNAMLNGAPTNNYFTVPLKIWGVKGLKAMKGGNDG